MKNAPALPVNCFMAVVCQFASRFLLNCCHLTLLKHKCRMIELPTYHWVFCKGDFQHINASGFYVSIDCWNRKETFGSIQHCASMDLVAGKRNWLLPLTVTSSLPFFLSYIFYFYTHPHRVLKFNTHRSQMPVSLTINQQGKSTTWRSHMVRLFNFAATCITPDRISWQLGRGLMAGVPHSEAQVKSWLGGRQWGGFLCRAPHGTARLPPHWSWMQEWPLWSWEPWGEEQQRARLGKGVALPGHSEAEDAEMGPHGWAGT